MKGFYRFVYKYVKPIFLLFFRMEVSGRENIPAEGGTLVCANHLSMFDPFFLVCAYPRQIHFMAKAELAKVPLFGFLIKKLGAVFVQRGKGDMSAIDDCLANLQQGAVVGIFPEGTRSKTGKPGSPKSGAALIAMRSGAAVQPVSIRYEKGKPRLFGRVWVHFGPVLDQAMLPAAAGEAGGLRRTSRAIMDSIIEGLALLEEKA